MVWSIKNYNNPKLVRISTSRIDLEVFYLQDFEITLNFVTHLKYLKLNN